MVEKVLIGVAVSLALAFCVMGAFAIYGFSGYRGEVCVHLGESKPVVSRLGSLARCVQQQPFVFELEGPKGSGRAVVKSTTDDHGNVFFQEVRFTTDAGVDELLPE